MTADGDLTGKTLGKCKILGRLGYGQTATLFRAFYKPLGKEVAVKILKKDAKAADELREKFMNEARALARLDHQNIVKVYDVVEDGEHLFIIMELLKGRDLWQVLKEDGPIEAERALEIATAAARALAAAHQEQIIHRDVKPQNIMLVGRRDRVKLVDFGLAAEGAVVGKAGTPFYMSPEQVQGKRVEAKTDVYSLGATLFHIMTGKPPYPGKTRKEIFAKVLGGQIPTASRANREVSVPKSLDPVVKRMMAPVPGYRYSAKDLVTALDDLKLSSGGKRRHTHAARAAVKRGKGAPVGLIIAAVAVVVAAVGVGGYLLLRKPAPPPQKQEPVAEKPEVKPVNPDYGIGNRAEDREARKNRAAQAYQAAQALEAKNPSDYARLIPEYQKIWDNEDFSGTVWDEKARERMRQLEAARDEEKAAAARLEKGKLRERAMETFTESQGRLIKAYDFATARAKLHDFMFEYGETKALALQYRRLEHAVRCMDALVVAINENRRKLPLSIVKPRAPETALIQSADEKGILVRDGSNDRKEAWSFLEPEELKKLIERQSWSREPLNLFFAYCLLTELGFPDDAEGLLYAAKARDNMGRVQQLEEELNGK
jgi:tRNA A-37 threonylcarbamoyl transferase component Bud32